MEQKTDLIEIIAHIDPALLNYQEWVNVGMALKHEGYTPDTWETWSSRDIKRYHFGECMKKWESFQGSSAPVTAGTIVQLAKDQGWSPEYTTENFELDWDSEIGGNKEDFAIIDKNWVEGLEIHQPNAWNPVKDLVTYLETLFTSDENVGYVTECWEKDGKFFPQKGCFDRTAGELIQLLNTCNGDIGAVLGDYNPLCGAWIRFNPLDGRGVKNENVSDFRYALVESDTEEIEKQNAIMRELELPIACMVHSGKKSIHAIVKIDAADYNEYRKRVDYLYNICKKNGLEIDSQNRNPSRLSRMPGVMRNGHKQYLIDTNIGKASFQEWQEWIEAINDDLPEPENMSAVWDHLPDLSPALIDGVLRQGHKMLIAGPSKAGKSYALIELCCAIAEGTNWFSWQCTQGKIMYVNLELDRASCLHRFKDVYTTLGLEPLHISNIDIWNLRGKSVPMDKLAPKLIRRAAKKNYIAIVIDPIYKVITGDENSADQMANFCNQFDKVCTELGCAVIYCHHHSKGGQGNKKSMDRASGSGVFARDPDALLDLIELETTDKLREQEENKAICRICEEWLKRYDMLEKASQDDLCNYQDALAVCRGCLKAKSYELLLADVQTARKKLESRTAWRIEGTLREFPKFAPVNLWFDYPIHSIDTVGSLKDIQPKGDTVWNKTWKKNFQNKKTPEQREKETNESLENAFGYVAENDKCAIADLAEYLGVSEKTVRRKLKNHGGFWVDSGECGIK